MRRDSGGCRSNNPLSVCLLRARKIHSRLGKYQVCMHRKRGARGLRRSKIAVLTIAKRRNMKQRIKKLSKEQKIIVGLIVLVIADIATFGCLKYTFYTVKCGGAPVAVTPKPMFWSGRRTYRSAGEYSLSSGNTYYCTKQEAVDSGYEEGVL